MSIHTSRSGLRILQWMVESWSSMVEYCGKIPLSALMQSTAESADCCSECE